MALLRGSMKNQYLYLPKAAKGLFAQTCTDVRLLKLSELVEKQL